MLKYVLYGFIALVVIIQFFQIDKSPVPTEPSQDFITMTHPPVEIKELLKSVCYDCHSGSTQYPWYTYVQPVGWWIGHHIEEGQEHLNFAQWGTYNEKRQKHKVTECIEEVEEGEMPLNSYTWAHSEARLSKDQRDNLIAWFKTLPHEEEHD